MPFLGSGAKTGGEGPISLQIDNTQMMVDTSAGGPRHTAANNGLSTQNDLSSILDSAAVGKEEHLIPGAASSAGLIQDPSSNALNDNYSHSQAMREESGLVARLEKDPSALAMQKKIAQAATASVMLRQPDRSRSQSEMNENTLTLPEAVAGSPYRVNGPAQQSNQLNE